MSCKDEAEKEAANLAPATGVAPGQVDGGERCVREGCSALVNLATGLCVEGHAQHSGGPDLAVVWKGSHPEQWQFLQDALAADPDNEFFRNLVAQIARRGNLSARQMAALEQARGEGLDQVRERQMLRANNGPWAAAARLLAQLRPLADRNHQSLNYEAAVEIAARLNQPGGEQLVLSPKQRLLIRDVLLGARTVLETRLAQGVPWHDDIDWGAAPAAVAVGALDRDVSCQPEAAAVARLQELGQAVGTVTQAIRAALRAVRLVAGAEGERPSMGMPKRVVYDRQKGWRVVLETTEGTQELPLENVTVRALDLAPTGRCLHPGCNAPLVIGENVCAHGHVQGAEGERVGETTAGKAGLTARSWSLVRRYKWMAPEDAAFVSSASLVQPMPEAGVRCQVCGRPCTAEAYEVEDARGLGKVMVGSECAKNLLGNINFRALQERKQEEEDAGVAAARAAQDQEEADRIAALLATWQEENQGLWQFLQEAHAEDPGNEFFRSLDQRLRRLGGLSEGQMSALERAAGSGLDEVRRRRDLRESDDVWGRAVEFVLGRMSVSRQDPAIAILRDIKGRRWQEAVSPVKRGGLAPLTDKQRGVVQRAARRYAKNQFSPHVRRKDRPDDDLSPDFWWEAVFFHAALQSQDLAHEPGDSATSTLYRVASVLRDAAGSQHLSSTRAADDIAIVDATTGEPVVIAGQPITQVVVQQVYLGDDNQWYVECGLRAQETLSDLGMYERPVVAVPIDESMQVSVLTDRGQPYWWLMPKEAQ